MATLTATCGTEFLVDDEDVDQVSQYCWSIRRPRNRKTVYVQATVNGRTVSLHRFLMNEPKGMQVDHKDRNGLNNQRDNLRVATRFQNAWNKGKQRDNKTGFKGVCWHSRNGKFIAQIGYNGGSKRGHLGSFDTAEEAARAYDKAARGLHGEFAYLNFPDERTEN